VLLLWWSQYARALLFLECYIRGWADGWSRLVLAEIQQATAVPEREGGRSGPVCRGVGGPVGSSVRSSIALGPKVVCALPFGGLT